MSSEAPVDDYFGHFGQSILEIRNRIVDIQSEADATLRTSDGIGAIEHIEDAVAAWKSQYPHDPWLALVLAHGRVIDATTSTPVAGALVLISDGTSNDPVSVPFATSATDGTFSHKRRDLASHIRGRRSAASEVRMQRTKRRLRCPRGNFVVKLAAPALAANAIAKP